MTDTIAYYISKKEFKKRLIQSIKSVTATGTQYAEAMIKEEAKQKPDENYLAWLRLQTNDIAVDLSYNIAMLRRADIEEKHALFWLDTIGNLLMRRCSEEEYEEIYKKRDVDYIW